MQNLTLAAASARLCVETAQMNRPYQNLVQPPPRGCVLKQLAPVLHIEQVLAAASARLCVETLNGRA